MQVEWEKQLVALSNAADKAKEKQSAAQLEREKLNGNKKVAGQEYDDEKAAYTLMVLPAPSPALSTMLRRFVLFSNPLESEARDALPFRA